MTQQQSNFIRKMAKSSTPAVQSEVPAVEIQTIPTIEERVLALELIINELINRKPAARELTDEQRLELNRRSMEKKRQQSAVAKGFDDWEQMQAAKAAGFLLGAPYKQWLATQQPTQE